MSSYVDILQAVADQIVALRDRVGELERLETYYGTLDLNGYTLTVTANTTLSGTPAAAVHTHAASDIVSGTVNTARLGSGTASSTTLLHGDNTWSAVDILAETTGTLSIARGGTGATSAGAALSALGGASASHSHAASDITSGTVNTARLGSGTASATTTLHGDNTWSAVDILTETTGTLSLARGGTGATSSGGALSAIGAAAASHVHAATDITSGTVATARLGSGTANSTTALFGDQTYKSVPTGSGADNCLVLWNGTTGLTYDSNTYSDGTTIVSTNFKFDSGGGYYDSSANKLLGTRRTGWSAWTGTATRSSKATSTATTADVAQALKALIDDLSTHGIIGG